MSLSERIAGWAAPAIAFGVMGALLGLIWGGATPVGMGTMVAWLGGAGTVVGLGFSFEGIKSRVSDSDRVLAMRVFLAVAAIGGRVWILRAVI